MLYPDPRRSLSWTRSEFPQTAYQRLAGKKEPFFAMQLQQCRHFCMCGIGAWNWDVTLEFFLSMCFIFEISFESGLLGEKLTIYINWTFFNHGQYDNHV